MKPTGIVFDALMAHQRPDGTPATLTAVIAERVRALRSDARLSGAALAAAMQERGVPWNRTTVAKLESGRRESVTVQELLALALVLDVPPVWLLADPTNGPVPVAKGTDADPWAVLLWMLGRVPLSGSASPAWDAAANPLGQVYELAVWLERFRDQRRAREVDKLLRYENGSPVVTSAELDEEDGKLLRSIARRLQPIVDSGFVVPPLPEDVIDRARELGVDLPKQEG